MFVFTESACKLPPFPSWFQHAICEGTISAWQHLITGLLHLHTVSIIVLDWACLVIGSQYANWVCSVGRLVNKCGASEVKGEASLTVRRTGCVPRLKYSKARFPGFHLFSKTDNLHHGVSQKCTMMFCRPKPSMHYVVSENQHQPMWTVHYKLLIVFYCT